MKYINTTTQAYPVTEGDIRAASPNTSFPAPFVAPQGYAQVFPAPQPAYNPVTHQVREVAPALTEKGHYEQRWEVLALDPEQVAANRAAAASALQSSIVQQTQQRLDDFARTRNYDGMLSLCTYATSQVPKFQAEGQYGVQARDATWATLYGILADVESGERPAPSSYADIELELPALAWPESATVTP